MRTSFVGKHGATVRRFDGDFLRGVRPATPLICQFIVEHRDQSGVAPICRAQGVHRLQIALQLTRQDVRGPP
jgi:hypothetical protein